MVRNAAGHVPTLPQSTFGPNAHNYVCFFVKAEGQKFQKNITQKKHREQPISSQK